MLTNGSVRLGWANLSFSPSFELGGDENSWAFDCSGGRKFFAGGSESYGKTVQVGDVIGCMLDLHDKTISFSLNGELLLDIVGSECAFSDIPTGEASYVPALTLGVGQKVRLIFGQDINALKYFTQCGLQEGYQPFCVNMNRNVTFWYNKDEPLFVDVDDSANVEVTRIPPGSDSPPALKISHKLFETQEKASWEFLQLSLPVTVHDQLIDDLTKSTKWEEVRRRMRRAKADRAGLRHPGNLEQHMLQSGFSISDVKDLQRAYSEEGQNENGTDSPQPQKPQIWKRPGSLTKTKSFDNELKVPTLNEAQAMMQAQQQTEKMRGAASVEALDRNARDATSAERKSRGKSPFKFFGKKDELQTQVKSRDAKVKPGRAAETGLEGFLTPNNVLAVPTIIERRPSLR